MTSGATPCGNALILKAGVGQGAARLIMNSPGRLGAFFGHGSLSRRLVVGGPVKMTTAPTTEFSKATPMLASDAGNNVTEWRVCRTQIKSMW